MNFNTQIETNRELWDYRANKHFNSEFYGVDEFRKGWCPLNTIELDELGDVSGKSLLHLQCHFGLDTLAWVRRGANAIGVDYSGSAINLAQNLAQEMELEARFILASVYELESQLDEQFDIVFTSYGVLKWLPDLSEWARLVARYLKAGGTFFVVEFHPFMYVFDYDRAEELTYSYFYNESPIVYDEVGSYAVEDDPVIMTANAWSHPVSSVIGHLLDSGLTLESFKEYPYTPIDCFPFSVEGEPGKYVHATHPGKVPFLYSVKATKN